ncbi:MAG: VWA domain-containing protein [Hyphomicrobiales bacterium]|nr:VWA domain-containing protein [Hyphomicrobiales bacterium]
MTILKRVRNFFNHKSGNVAATFAIALLPIMLSVGAAIDYSRMSNLHNKVAIATDAALLAAVANVMNSVDLKDTAAVNARLKEEFEPLLLANMYGADSYIYNGFTINFDPKTGGVDVNVDVDYNAAIFGLVGLNKLDTDVEAATSMQVKAGGAISMFLVLDRSGSMDWSNGDGGTKMQSLQLATIQMISNFRKYDPNEEFIRMGSVAYSSHTWSVQQIKWDLDYVKNYVDAMLAGGGTDSSNAVEQAYNMLTKKSEITEHEKKNDQEPDLVLVFMTDGDNNSPGADSATKITCSKAKNYGIEIYTIAFQAPAKGQGLLKYCASSSAHYFEPENTDELIDSFKSIGKNVSDKLVLAK